jgi:hypothetical protein
MPEGFVPLEVALRRTPGDETATLQIHSAVESPPAASASADMPGDGGARDADALAGVRRFHAALADAVDASVDDLLRDIACEVLGRELTLAPADLACIAAAALRRYADDSPVRLRAHPDEMAALTGLNLPVVADCELRRGDVTVDLRAGSIDARLGTRLESVLESLRGV